MNARMTAGEFKLGQRRRALWDFVNERSDISVGDVEELADIGWIRWRAESCDYALTDLGREQLPKDGQR